MSSSCISYLKTFLQLCAVLSLVVTCINAEDFYKLLGISKGATTKEIKKAYRQKSLEHHPDKNKAEGAADKFAEINRAYEVLMDDDKRQIYDRHGEEGLKQHEQRGGGGGGGGFDPFQDFFNFGGRQRRDQEMRTEAVDIPLELSLEELYIGATYEIEYIRQVLCLKWEMCLKTNQECQGAGIRMRRQQVAPGFVQQIQQADERCVSPGKMWLNNCSDCPKKTETEKIGLTIDVTKGMREKEQITFEGVTDERPGYKPGDLNFVIIQKPHSEYHREGDHLYKNMEIPLVHALTGFSMTLTQLDGEEFSLNVDDVVECDHVLRVPGKGMPRRNGRGYGDLFIKFEVDFPDKLTQEQKDTIRTVLGDSSPDEEKEEGEL